MFQERARLFKGPCISVKLPFRKGNLDKDWFTAFVMEHVPYLHQEKAFKRLTGENGQSTIISTGTGSGKTECFLYPILDYLLIRPIDVPLWKENGPESLKYLVVDELHTFDGAQGTDLACLLRRLKARVKAPSGHVCCVGTSATLGGGEDLGELRAYARKVFDEPFLEDSVVLEDRYAPSEFFGDSYITRSGAVDSVFADDLVPDRYSDWQAYIARQYALWFGREVDGPMDEAWVIELGQALKQHAFFRNLILVLKNRTMALEEMAASLRKIDAGLADADDMFLHRLLESLLALISVARGPKEKEGSELPTFLDVRVQVWMRELRRVVSDVVREPHLRFSDDLKPEQLRNHLPLIHCRECGAMGWAAVKRRQDNAFASDLQAFYQAFFNYSPTVHFIFPDAEEKGAQRELPTFVCGNCLQMGVGEAPAACPSCGREDTVLPAHIVNQRVRREDRVYGSHNCPYCESHDSLTIVGSRSASLLSVVIGQLFSSTYANDPSRKLLTFSDSVQDASHRAGFFEARTCRFNFRTALQKVVAHEDGSISLEELCKRFSVFWRKRLDPPDYIATFLAPDMEWFEDYESLKGTGEVPTGSSSSNNKALPT